MNPSLNSFSRDEKDPETIHGLLQQRHHHCLASWPEASYWGRGRSGKREEFQYQHFPEKGRPSARMSMSDIFSFYVVS